VQLQLTQRGPPRAEPAPQDDSSPGKLRERRRRSRIVVRTGTGSRDGLDSHTANTAHPDTHHTHMRKTGRRSWRGLASAAGQSGRARATGEDGNAGTISWPWLGRRPLRRARRRRMIRAAGLDGEIANETGMRRARKRNVRYQHRVPRRWIGVVLTGSRWSSRVARLEQYGPKASSRGHFNTILHGRFGQDDASHSTPPVGA
jgi:hypothetical protein